MTENTIEDLKTFSCNWIASSWSYLKVTKKVIKKSFFWFFYILFYLLFLVNCAVSDWSKCKAGNSPESQQKVIKKSFSWIFLHFILFVFLVKCVVSEWSECKATNLLDCGPGTQTRTVKTPARYGGEGCPELTKSCEMSKKCPG